MDKVLIFDTTLRDGEQALSSSLSVKEKIVIAHALAKLNVDIIEAGFPVSSPGDLESVRQIANSVKGPIVAGLARAVRKDIDACAKALKECPRPRIHTFIATSNMHVESKLKKGYDEVIQMGVDAVSYARNFCDDVEFSCEDAGRTDRDMLCRIVEATINAGAKTINIPDTVGYTVGYEFGDIIKDIFNRVPNIDKATISVHCHNDLGQAAANSLMAVLNGARQIECTVNGLGERAGNCSMEEVVMAMRTRKDIFGIDTGIVSEEISHTSRLVSKICNVPVQPNKAIVGATAFAHSSGIHQDGVLKNRSNYEIMTPESVGLSANQFHLTSRSGRHIIKHRLSLLGYEEDSYDLDQFYDKFLALADKKGTVYDDDLEAMMEIDGDEADRYKMVYLNTTSGTGSIPSATVKIHDNAASDAEPIQEAATGDGPVDAACKAIDRAVGFSIKMVDYALTGLTGGKNALGEVKIIAEHKERRYHGQGSSTDIVEASALAYMNVINKVARMEGIEKMKEMKA
ncbi:MAG: 2-isopropylmalate synthase [Spirochaetales bacterium]|nr:2-isopropylmalate synthase [Spirochaetales bacterium]